MKLRAPLALMLTLMLAVTSVTTAVAHARTIGSVELELCDAHGGTAKLLLYAAGNPIADPRHCPDCLAATLAPDGTPADLPARPLTRSEPHVCALPIPVEDETAPEPAARGPPPLL